MGLENLKKANEAIQEINKRRDEKRLYSKNVWGKIIEQSPVKDRRPPEDFKSTSFLFIRSYDSDNGVRPGLSVTYWL